MEKRYPVLRIICMSLVLVICGCVGRKPAVADMSRETEKRVEEIERCLGQEEYGKSDSLSRRLLAASCAAHDAAGEARALFYLGVYTGDSVRERRENLHKAERMAEELKDYRLLSQICNSLGITEMAAFRSYDLAHGAFVRSIRYANQAGAPELAVTAESNLSDALRLVNDTLGITHDKAVFEYAVKHNDRSLLISSAFHCGLHYAKHLKDTMGARRYLSVLDTIDGYRHYSDYIRALWHFNNGNLPQAARHIEAARKASPSSSSIALLEAEILNKAGNYAASDSAILRIDRGDVSDRTDNGWIEAYRIEGSNALATGQYARAARSLWEYTLKRDSISRVIDGASIAHYKMMYEVEKKNAELQAEREKRRMMIAGISVAAIIVGLVLGFLVWHNRRKDRLYRAMVKQNRGFIEREHFFEQRISELMDEVAQEKAKGERGLKSEIKANTFQKLWQRILYEMEERQAYKNRNLSRDSMAEELETNHFYLTEVVKENTGLTFPQFVNGYRVREAARMLEDRNNDKSVKEIAGELGFSSTAALHTSFSKAFGMSPGIYRKVSRKDIDEKDNDTDAEPDAVV